MVRIRLTRTGAKNNPSWRIGAFDQRTRRDGHALEILGYYNPLEKDSSRKVTMDTERIQHWLSKGAQPSKAVQKFLKQAGVQWKK